MTRLTARCDIFPVPLPRFLLRISTGLPVCALAGLSLLLSPDARADSALTQAQASAFIAPFYEALTASSAEAVSERLRSVTTSAWASCATNDVCEPRDAVIARWSRRIAVVPDLRWDLKEVLVAGDRIIVRGEGTGTPSGAFLGAPHSGRSFRVLAIDIHVVEGGKVVRTHHVEDWAGAARQLRGEGL
ncbi:MULTISPECIES: ester cyclase [Burkholderia cepacia complex]|uniref:ester cyclase n=1 Tax=Burkholderia cepacia complex TaxID=87882 RepID=UPI001178C7BF|nr:ester cyclase [Burkholderia cenocepacia]MBR8077699.1 ester cyclase [Burkholderia cenocepacia]